MYMALRRELGYLLSDRIDCKERTSHSNLKSAVPKGKMDSMVDLTQTEKCDAVVNEMYAHFTDKRIWHMMSGKVNSTPGSVCSNI